MSISPAPETTATICGPVIVSALCGVADDSGMLLHERFTACRYFKDEHFYRVVHPGSGLINQLSQEWQVGKQPRLITAQLGEAGDWQARLDEH